MTDCLIVGAGVVGLSLAYELAEQGARVRLIDAGLPGAESSWAGAGILPPAGSLATDATERLTALSNQLHARWHERLREEDRDRQRLPAVRRGLSGARPGPCRRTPSANRPVAARGDHGRRARRPGGARSG